MSTNNTGLTYLERQHQVHQLRAKGWTIRAIAQAVGLSPAGVHKALGRPPGAPDGRGQHPNSRHYFVAKQQ
ncbi:hypothetical protein [Mycobacterium sp. NAZ190054]|uniref:hypothetical protein n=1 Tax=Mycobacterium sp. NAZ190054 TaxID=1747766 RepID=UPI000798FF22|nr:hypothetical protein [Mycobacterium sp. NAZ190054]KWX67750.1 hypothetical protein ASJ79_04070 [Mycobacterium sp. NAZ190054]